MGQMLVEDHHVDFGVFGDMLRAPERYLEWGWDTELWMAVGGRG